jgi:dienelactone hydrolase
MLAPQCPEHLRWSTDDWFETFYKEATTLYRIDAARVYLTGPSLGGSGTWYIAARYPLTFAAIAPISGFTSHLDYIDKNIGEISSTLPVFFAHILTTLSDSFPCLPAEAHDEFIDAVTYRIFFASPFFLMVFANSSRTFLHP